MSTKRPRPAYPHGELHFLTLLRHVDSAFIWGLMLCARYLLLSLWPSIGAACTGSLLALLALQLSASHLVSVPNMICNLALILPFNAMAIIGFVLLTPIRWLYNHLVSILISWPCDVSCRLRS